MNELYLKYGNKGIFRKEEVIKDFPHLKVGTITEKIKGAKKSKLIKGIKGRRSIYFIVEPGQEYETARPDSFQLAAKFTLDAIICYASALMVFGKSHAILNTMYISSETRFRELKYQGVKYRYVPLPKREVSIQVIQYKGVSVRVTTIERTLIDCLTSLKYSGGFENLYRSYESVAYINWKKLEDCLKHFKSNLLKARVGFFVELFKDKWGIPEDFREKGNIVRSYFSGRTTEFSSISTTMNFSKSPPGVWWSNFWHGFIFLGRYLGFDSPNLFSIPLLWFEPMTFMVRIQDSQRLIFRDPRSFKEILSVLISAFGSRTIQAQEDPRIRNYPRCGALGPFRSGGQLRDFKESRGWL